MQIPSNSMIMPGSSESGDSEHVGFLPFSGFVKLEHEFHRILRHHTIGLAHAVIAVEDQQGQNANRNFKQRTETRHGIRKFT
jgi:hypothetical protein